MGARVFVVFFAVVVVVVAKDVTLNKCCRMDEYLNKETNYTCVKSNGVRDWNVKVFDPDKSGFIDGIPEGWLFQESARPRCSKPMQYSVVSSMVNYIVAVNGSVFVPSLNSSFFPPQDYCLDYEAILVCTPELMAPKVRKCCSDGFVYTHLKNTCVKATDVYKVPLKEGFAHVDAFPECESEGNISLAVVGTMRESELFENASIRVKKSGLFLEAETFCLVNVLESPESPSILTCHNYVFNSSSELPSTSLDQPADLRFTLYPIGLALSAIFLAATLAAGFLLPASHHMLHWRCQTNYVVCLLIGYVLLCITQLSATSSKSVPCFIIAVIMHFWFLAAFFWLNTMCFNIWWTFRDLRPQSIEKSQERCRLRLYEIYAWGGPFLIAGTAAILDLAATNTESSFLRPKFCENTAWFSGDVEMMTFFYGPIGALLIVNLALFAATARELTCGLWKRELVKSTSERAALGRVCMKLVVVMGVTWIMDVISWACGGPQELWYLPDLINCLQGVFIFIVIGCQPQVLTAAKRLWCWRRRGTAGTVGNTHHHSSSSQGLPSMGDTITNHSVTNNTTKSVPLDSTC